MRDVLGPGTIIGYCTNVHGGATLDETKRNLEVHARAVKERVSPNDPLGTGLWLSASAARELIQDHDVEEFREWLEARGLEVFTLNGFPYGDFHRDVVKHEVYLPDWCDDRRVCYTMDLVSILADLIPAGSEASISTLPIGWRPWFESSGKLEQAARNLVRVAERLEAVEQDTGLLIHLDLEPEPGCFFDGATDVVGFFEESLFPLGNPDRIRRYLRVCHDICHSAVVFEDQHDAIEQYRAGGIEVGKVQVSNAVRLDLSNLSEGERSDAIAQLGAFAEDQYLHQTMIVENDTAMFFDDLSLALAQHGRGDEMRGEWRVHFHVPIYLESFDLIGTTRGHIAECVDLLRGRVNHWEVETYAWNVLPDQLRHDTLAEGIAKEMQWFVDVATKAVHPGESNP